MGDTERDYKTYKAKSEAFDQLIDPIKERMNEVEQRPDTKKYVTNVLSKLEEAKAAIEEKMPGSKPKRWRRPGRRWRNSRPGGRRRTRSKRRSPRMRRPPTSARMRRSKRRLWSRTSTSSAKRRSRRRRRTK